MSELKVSVSGIRGIWGQSLTLSLLKNYTQAFARYIKNHKGHRVVIGRDARPTGKMISDYVTAILNAMGIDTYDIGIVPTPTVLFGVREKDMDAGIIITASHNPVQWNALKFVKKGGVFTGEKDLEEILSYLDMEIREESYDKIGHQTSGNTLALAHIERVLENVDVELIRAQHYKVVLDPVNSAGSQISQELLARLGCEVKVLNGEMHGSFDRGTEPIPAHLQHMTPVIREFRADAGFAQDPDADRLVLVDNEGTVLSEEKTLALALDNVLDQHRGDVVINMSTSRMNEDIARKYGVKCYRTKVGEANVVEGITEHQALIAGEGNGGVIYPTINTGRDSLAGIALILEYMARTGKTLSQLSSALPAYTMLKEKYEWTGDLKSLYAQIEKAFPQARPDTLDGLRLDWEVEGQGIWIHIRPSNTEPVIRVIGEALREQDLKAAFSKVQSLL